MAAHKNIKRIGKILALSDFQVPELSLLLEGPAGKGLDLILSCGDLPPEYLSSLRHKLNVPLFYVRGNHDIRYADSPPDGCTNLHAQLKVYRGMRILGLEGSYRYSGGPAQYTESEMRRMIRRLRPRIWWSGGVDIVFAHAPPSGVHDAEDLCHRGFESFQRLINRYRPGYFFHGHVHARFEHPSERITRVNRTRVVNCCGYYLLEDANEPMAG